MKTNIERLKEILSIQQGIGTSEFRIDKYCSEGWLGDEDISKALDKLIKELP